MRNKQRQQTGRADILVCRESMNAGHPCPAEATRSFAQAAVNSHGLGGDKNVPPLAPATADRNVCPTGCSSRPSRRGVLAASLASLPAAAAFTLIPSTAFGANERLVVANIGVGGMGTVHLKNMLAFQKEGKVRIAAVCDVDETRLANAVKTAGAGVEPYRDYRYILQRKDIDAVLIGTPDHWHGVQTVHACESGKHVYVEKPSSVTIEEGLAMIAAARANKVAVQVGAQGRTGKGAWQTCRAIRNGIIGKVSRVECWHYANPVDEKPAADGEPPASLDWDLWLGPLPWRPYNPRYCPGVFRWFLESGGGQIRDRGAHQFSTILWCMDADRYTSFTVEAKGTPPAKGLWDCPVDMDVTYQFKNPDWTLVWGQPGNKRGKTEFGQTFLGDKGQLILEWEGAYRGASQEAIDFKMPEGAKEVYRTAEYDDFNMNHKADWLKSIREGHLRPAVDIEIAHRTASLCILGNISYILGRKLEFDAEKQRVVGDEQANRLLGKPQRYPYVL